MTRQRASILVFLAVAVATSILYASTNIRRSTTTPFLRNEYTSNLVSDATNPVSDQDQRRRQLASFNLAQYIDPVSIRKKSNDESTSSSSSTNNEPREQFSPVNHSSRERCQIIYLLGVEGAAHHGFVPVIESLARHQKDPETNLEYDVDSNPEALKAGLFGWFPKSKISTWGFAATPEVDDPAFVQTVVRESCPDDGRKHVLIEWASFPSGLVDDHRAYRVHRQRDWETMTPDEIANTDEALQHPTNMNAFYQAYNPYVDIKFIVLHRPFLETIAAHHDWDGGPPIHSNVIRGFMLMLRRFLDTHIYDLVNGRRLWSLVCVERIMAKNYKEEYDVKKARRRLIGYLTKFLDWPDGDCPHCFDDWRDSKKDARDVLGEENVALLEEHMKYMEGIWPPPGEDGVVEQQCAM